MHAHRFRVGRWTIAFTALLCIAAPIPAFTQHVPDGACDSSLSTLGRVALVVWALAGGLVLGSVIVDLMRARPWALLALPFCVLVSLVALVLIFDEAPLCFGLGSGQRGEHVGAVALELRGADAGDLRQLAQ
jgi:peptidoglycan/LPS O-acetylase OafA/YrhL